MTKKVIQILLLFFILIEIPAFAPNISTDYSFVSIQKELHKQFLRDEDKKYQKNLRDFKRALAHRESGNNWKEYNPYGYIGKYQFGKAALEITGYGNVDFVSFMSNPSIFPEKDQDKAMDSLLSFNQLLLEPFIEKYSGRYIMDSVKITRIGLLAAAHLAGPGNVKRFLESNGQHNPIDQMGTALSDYLTTFGAHL